jgi:transposase-like protein
MTKQDRMFAMIAKWRRSGMSKAEFARQAGVSTNTFHYWCRRFEEENGAVERSTFVEVGDVDQRRDGVPRVRLEYPDGVIISVY